MARLVRMYRFPSPPCFSPAHDCLSGWAEWPELQELFPPNPAIPFNCPEEIRTVFSRHQPRMRWEERGNGRYIGKRGEISVILPARDHCYVSLALDATDEILRLLKAVEADRPDWYTAWDEYTWLRDVPV